MGKGKLTAKTALELAQKRVSRRSGLSLDFRKLGFAVAMSVLIAGALICLQQLLMIWNADNNERHLEKMADWVAATVSDRFEGERRRVAAAASRPEVIGFFNGSTPRGVAEAAALSEVPQAATVRLHTPNVERTGFADGISFAALDMLLRARESGTAQPVELHWFGTDRQRFSIVEPVVVDDRVIGLVEAALPGNILSDVVDVLSDNNAGYIDLRQGTGDWRDLVIASAGRVLDPNRDKISSRNVAGTQFRVTYGAGLGFTFLQTRNTTLLFIAIIAMLGLAVGLVFLRRRLDQVAPTQTKEAVLADIITEEPAEQVELDPKLLKKLEQVEKSEGRTGGTGRVKAAKDIDASMFRAYDIRGIVGKALTAEATCAIGLAIGSEGRERGIEEIVVARDGRLSGPDLIAALIEGLRQSGVNVIDVGAVPTPVLYFAAQQLGGGSGVMVTGSHNPPDYNGFKIVLGGETLSGEAIQALYQRIVEHRYADAEEPGGVQEMDVVEDYVDAIAGDVQVEEMLKVVVDAGNGIAGAIAPQLLEEIGCEAIPLYCDVDGTFPNHHPDPSVPDNLRDLIAAVDKLDADLGIAFDGDGDRLGVVSRNGEMIYPDRLLMLFAQDVLSRKPGAPIIYDVKCTGHLAAQILSHGGSPVMWKTGHSLIKAKMKEIDAELAGEMSGHFFFKERWYGFDDGLYSAARLLEIIAADGRDAQEIFDELPKGVSTPELKITTAEGENYRFIDRFQKYANFAEARITSIDGVRADFDDGWGLVRASNTTPCLVLRFDADNEDALKRIQDAFREQILAVDDQLELPF